MKDTRFCVAPIFVPADRPERFLKAASTGADALIIDLEDAVAPENKRAARSALCQPGVLPENVEIFVRVNALSTPWHADDIMAASGLNITGVVLPKAEHPADIANVANRLDGRQITALIETALGLAMVRDIARAPAATRLAFGSIDFCADLGLAHIREALLAARSELVLASRLGDCLPPLDGVTTSLRDASLVEDDARYARALGFGGKLCIHPAQIAAVLQGFAPSEEEIAWAERMLAVAEQGAGAVDGVMVDAPVRARARQILARRTNK